MIVIEKGLSNCVMYYWYNHIDEPRWYTKKEILGIKEDLDKKYVWHFVKFWGIIFAMVLMAAAFACFCFYVYETQPMESYHYICGLAKLPLIVLFPCAFAILPHLDRELIAKRESFYETFGKALKEENEKKAG